MLIVLTDYYGHGVPGDQYIRDNPQGCDFYVLPAPWFRRGIQRYSFQPECGDPAVTDVPNYEVFYKPWVRQLVSDLAESPAILGWQLGNELKARNNVRNEIEDGYDWYLDFVKDMTDTIRSVDKNHLIFVGAQYFGELTDIPYRPGSGGIEPFLRTEYFKAVKQMATACGQYCWNVWPLTFYDFNPYPADDAMIMRRGGIATLATEFGFTLGTPSEEQVRFGGNRPRALRMGLKRPWQDIDGHWHDEQWSLRRFDQPVRADRRGPVGLAESGPEDGPGQRPRPAARHQPGAGGDGAVAGLDRRGGGPGVPEREGRLVGRVLLGQQLREAAREQAGEAPGAGPAADGEAGGMPPKPPLDLEGIVTGISTDSDEPVADRPGEEHQLPPADAEGSVGADVQRRRQRPGTRLADGQRRDARDVDRGRLQQALTSDASRRRLEGAPGRNSPVLRPFGLPDRAVARI